MIIPGRSTNGYSDFENIFYLLDIELNNAILILKNNNNETLKKYESDKEKVKSQEKKFNLIVKEFSNKYIKEGENYETAISIAKCDAQAKLNIDINSIYDQIDNNG